MNLSNVEVARMLHEVAAAYTLKKGPSTHSTNTQGRTELNRSATGSGQGNLFQIRAYESAASAIENSTSEIKDLWEEGRLDSLSGIGPSLKTHLEELFKTGKVKHWESVKKGIPEVVFELLEIPGIGPKTALELANLSVKSEKDLEKKIESGILVKQGFSDKVALRIQEGLKQMTFFKSGRMLLPYAFTQAQRVLDYLKKNPKVKQADALGSLRRMVATIGDLDFAVASDYPKEVVSHIVKMPGISDVVDKGDTKVTVVLSSGLHLDFLIADPKSYGALLQHFTGSKLHNIHLRKIAEKKGLSLSEYGARNIRNGKIEPTETEEEFYNLMGMQTPPPELREDTGEIEASLKHQLPDLVEVKDIRGDLHIHSSFPIDPSHDLGVNSIEEIVSEAKRLRYEYVGVADHQPSASKHTEEQIINLIKKRTKLIEQINSSQKSVRVLNLLELDILPDGKLSVPEESLKLLDFAIAGVHTLHHQSKELMTKRILQALGNPYVKVLTHPTNRLLNERQSSEVDWEAVFKLAARNNKALEINAYPNRLDLVDTLVKLAITFGVKLIINTDSHKTSEMENMKFGVAVARRGWATKKDIINSWDFKKLTQWFNI